MAQPTLTNGRISALVRLPNGITYQTEWHTFGGRVIREIRRVLNAYIEAGVIDQKQADALLHIHYIQLDEIKIRQKEQIREKKKEQTQLKINN